MTWTKDGQPLDLKRANIRNSDKDTIFFIRMAKLADSGKYEMTLKVDGLEDRATIEIQVIGKHSAFNGLGAVLGWDFTQPLPCVLMKQDS